MANEDEMMDDKMNNKICIMTIDGSKGEMSVDMCKIMGICPC